MSSIMPRWHKRRRLQHTIFGLVVHDGGLRTKMSREDEEERPWDRFCMLSGCSNRQRPGQKEAGQKEAWHMRLEQRDERLSKKTKRKCQKTSWAHKTANFAVKKTKLVHYSTYVRIRRLAYPELCSHKLFIYPSCVCMHSQAYPSMLLASV